MKIPYPKDLAKICKYEIPYRYKICKRHNNHIENENALPLVEFVWPSKTPAFDLKWELGFQLKSIYYYNPFEPH
jgi:hypothetical protein